VSIQTKHKIFYSTKNTKSH